MSFLPFPSANHHMRIDEVLSDDIRDLHYGQQRVPGLTQVQDDRDAVNPTGSAAASCTSEEELTPDEKAQLEAIQRDLAEWFDASLEYDENGMPMPMSYGTSLLPPNGTISWMDALHTDNENVPPEGSLYTPVYVEGRDPPWW